MPCGLVARRVKFKIIAVRFHAPGVEVVLHARPTNKKSVATNTISIVPPVPGKRARENDITDKWPTSNLLRVDDRTLPLDARLLHTLPSPTNSVLVDGRIETHE